MYELNIAKVLSLATEDERVQGRHWYEDAFSIAVTYAARYGVTQVQAVGVIAAISPGSEWSLNIRNAATLLDSHAKGEVLPLVGSYGWRNVRKCEKILATKWHHSEVRDILKGPKVSAFFSNILGIDDDSVTIDRHAKAAAMGRRLKDDETTVTAKQYREIAAAYRNVAKHEGLEPKQLQAIVWVVWKRLLSEEN